MVWNGHKPHPVRGDRPGLGRLRIRCGNLNDRGHCALGHDDLERMGEDAVARDAFHPRIAQKTVFYRLRIDAQKRLTLGHRHERLQIGLGEVLDAFDFDLVNREDTREVQDRGACEEDRNRPEDNPKLHKMAMVACAHALGAACTLDVAHASGAIAHRTALNRAPTLDGARHARARRARRLWTRRGPRARGRCVLGTPIRSRGA